MLYLLPNLLDEELPIEPFFPISVSRAVQSIQGLIAESEKMGRRYLRKFISHDEMQRIPIKPLNEHQKEIEELIKPLEKGESWGLISDAGLPCIADPGSELVYLAHQKKIEVQAFVGPSSIFMALQLSGFSGQKFSFHGYLPREQDPLISKIKELEKEEGTQIWIETPYRLSKMLEILKETLQPKTRLCLALNLTTPKQKVISQPISQWKKMPLELDKSPAVFLISS